MEDVIFTNDRDEAISAYRRDGSGSNVVFSPGAKGLTKTDVETVLESYRQRADNAAELAKRYRGYAREACEAGNTLREAAMNEEANFYTGKHCAMISAHGTLEHFLLYG